DLMEMQNPAAPHAVYKFDNFGRPVSMALLEDPFEVSNLPVDPAASSMSKRRGLWTANYDEAGDVWKQSIYNVDQSSGASGDALDMKVWHSVEGSVVATISPQGIQKSTYNRDCPLAATYAVATAPDTSYSAMSEVQPTDTVVEEHHYRYNAAGELMADVY